MNDIERYDFWHREQDAFVRKIKESLWESKVRESINDVVKDMEKDGPMFINLGPSDSNLV
jgi:hypothetical protein